MCFELLFGGAEHWLFICVNCIIFLTCWNFVSLSIPIVTCGLRLQLLTAMGRANMDVIWNDLVLQSKPLLACCGTGHHTLWACNLSLVNLTQDMPTHTWNPLNAFLFKICFWLCDLSHEGGLRWFVLARLCQEFITMSECQAEQDMGTFLLLLQHVALDCVTGMKRPLEFSMSTLHRFVG